MRYSSEDDRGGLLIAGLEQGLPPCWSGAEKLSSTRPMFVAGQQDAIWLARRGHLELAVVNRQLADGDGLRLTSLLKEITPGLTVIVTGDGLDPNEEVEAYASGASLYLPHPVDAGLLAQVIASCLARAGRSPEVSVA